MFLHEFRTMGAYIGVAARCATLLGEHLKAENIPHDYRNRLFALEKQAKQILEQILQHADDFQQEATNETIDVKIAENTFNHDYQQSEACILEIKSFSSSIVENFSLAHNAYIQIILDSLNKLPPSEHPRMWFDIDNR